MSKLKERDTISKEIKPRKRKLSLPLESLECPLCQTLLYEPITTSCGHTFCKCCILRVMDHSNRCPLCRTVIYITPEHGISFLLQEIIQQNFPRQLKQRREEIQNELDSQKFNLPLFLLGDTILFPRMTLPLHVFEPRYRLMIRRCLEGARRFGIVPTINGELMKIGTVAVIENHWILPDGRSLIATLGDARFQIADVWDQDGYKVAKIDYLQDEPIKDKNAIDEIFEETRNLVIEKFSSQTLNQIQEKLGKMPMTANEFTWWLSYILPVPVGTKYELLKLTSLEKRLKFLMDHFKQLDLTELEAKKI